MERAHYQKKIRPKAKIVKIEDGFAYFDAVKLPVRPMIGTIGVAPDVGWLMPRKEHYMNAGNVG